MQYTIRKVPPALDRALRDRARAENKSLNEVAVDALARALGLAEQPVRCRNLRDLAGSWQEDPEFDQAIADQDTVEPAPWG